MVLLTIAGSGDFNVLLGYRDRFGIFTGLVKCQAALVHLLELRRSFLSDGRPKLPEQEEANRKACPQTKRNV